MQRRTVLRNSALFGTIALAGCIGGSDDDPGDGNGNSTDTPTSTPSSFTGFGDYSVSTTNTGCNEGDDGSASVAFDGDAPRVTVTGTLQASNPCHEASFEGVQYDDENDEIVVTIAAKPDGSNTCVQCVGAIEYEATLNLDGGLPTAVVVEHGTGSDATVVADVTSDGSS